MFTSVSPIDFPCVAMAGNIIPAIATTNAIVAGMMVMLAFKVLNKRIADCKTVRVLYFLNYVHHTLRYV